MKRPRYSYYKHAIGWGIFRVDNNDRTSPVEQFVAGGWLFCTWIERNRMEEGGYTKLSESDMFLEMI